MSYFEDVVKWHKAIDHHIGDKDIKKRNRYKNGLSLGKSLIDEEYQEFLSELSKHIEVINEGQLVYIDVRSKEFS